MVALNARAPSVDFLVDLARDADPAGLGDALEARRYVDAVAVDAHVVIDHVAEKAAYEKAIGHATSDSTVYNLLHRHGWRKLMPRPFHPKRDLAAQDAFKKTAFLML